MIGLLILQIGGIAAGAPVPPPGQSGVFGTAPGLPPIPPGQLPVFQAPPPPTPQLEDIVANSIADLLPNFRILISQTRPPALQASVVNEFDAHINVTNIQASFANFTPHAVIHGAPPVVAAIDHKFLGNCTATPSPWIDTIKVTTKHGTRISLDQGFTTKSDVKVTVGFKVFGVGGDAGIDNSEEYNFKQGEETTDEKDYEDTRQINESVPPGMLYYVTLMTNSYQDKTPFDADVTVDATITAEAYDSAFVPVHVPSFTTTLKAIAPNYLQRTYHVTGGVLTTQISDDYYMLSSRAVNVASPSECSSPPPVILPGGQPQPGEPAVGAAVPNKTWNASATLSVEKGNSQKGFAPVWSGPQGSEPVLYKHGEMPGQ